jgi:hypothetical protein
VFWIFLSALSIKAPSKRHSIGGACHGYSPDAMRSD